MVAELDLNLCRQVMLFALFPLKRPQLWMLLQSYYILLLHITRHLLSIMTDAGTGSVGLSDDC